MVNPIFLGPREQPRPRLIVEPMPYRERMIAFFTWLAT